MCKNKLLWFDLLVCTLWLWAILGGRYTWSSPVELIALVVVFLRITTAFLLQKSEIRAWLPLGIMSGCLGLLVGVSAFPGLDILVRYPFIVNGIDQPTAIRNGNSMANALFLRASSHIRTCMKASPRTTA